MTRRLPERKLLSDRNGCLRKGVELTYRAAKPLVVLASATTVAHAQGTIDFSGATALMGTFKTATLLAGNLGGLLVCVSYLEKRPSSSSAISLIEDWAERDHLRMNNGVDRQIVQSPVHWESDHLRIGKRSVQIFSLQLTPEASRPCLFSDLAKLNCDSILCSTWRPRSTTAARNEIDRQEKFIEFFKVGVFTRVMSGRDFASLNKGAGARAANNQVHDLGDVIRSLEKKAGRVRSPVAYRCSKSCGTSEYRPGSSPRLRRSARAGHGRNAWEAFRVLRHVSWQRKVQRLPAVAR